MTTLRELRSFRPDREQVAAAETVFMCMAAVQTIEPIVRGYQRKVLRELGWCSVDPDRSYDLPDSVFVVYLKRCNEERIAAKLHVDDEEYCPLLVAEDLLRQSRRLLIDLMEPVHGISFDQIFCCSDALANYDQLVDLNLQLLASYCKNKLKEV